MKNRLPLKHKLLCLDASQDVWFEPKEFINLCANARGYLVHESDLHMLVELVHRVINRDNFTEFAAKVNKEVLGND